MWVWYGRRSEEFSDASGAVYLSELLNRCDSESTEHSRARDCFKVQSSDPRRTVACVCVGIEIIRVNWRWRRLYQTPRLKMCCYSFFLFRQRRVRRTQALHLVYLVAAFLFAAENRQAITMSNRPMVSDRGKFFLELGWLVPRYRSSLPRGKWRHSNAKFPIGPAGLRKP